MIVVVEPMMVDSGYWVHFWNIQVHTEVYSLFFPAIQCQYGNIATTVLNLSRGLSVFGQRRKGSQPGPTRFPPFLLIISTNV